MNTPNDLHIMVDIETLSNDTRTGVMFSIGAVAFTLTENIEPPTTGEYAVSTGGRKFYLPIIIPGQRQYGLSADPETLSWWFENDTRCMYFTSICASLYARPIKDVFYAFHEWIQVLLFGTEAKISLWSHGVTYDCVHLAEKWPKIMGVSFNTVCPFRQMRDTRTLFAMYEAEYGKTPYPDGSKNNEMKHHPLYDAYVQAVATQTALRSFMSVVAGEITTGEKK